MQSRTGRRLVAVIALGAMGLALAHAAGAAMLKIDWRTFGFPNTVAQLIIEPDQAADVTLGDTRVQIPAGAFGAHPARFTLLMGQNSFFQPYAPSGQRVIASFAFEVVDLITGEQILKFQKPVVYNLTRPEVSAQSAYWDTTPSAPPHVLKNPFPARFTDHTLTHGNIGAPVGWLVTSPQ
jgi:hypothetical protein